MVIWLCTRSASALTTTGAVEAFGEAAGNNWANSRQAIGNKYAFMRWVRFIGMILT
jgi:hypothetical protein